MKNPNGYGSISKLSGNRRKPYMVRRTVQRTPEGKQIFEVLGYYATRKEAMQALAKYNENPNQFKSQDITFAELYEKFAERKFKRISESGVNGYRHAYVISEPLYGMKFVDIKSPQLQHIIDTCGKGYPTLRKLKVLYNQMFKFARELDIVDKDYSEFIVIGSYEDQQSRMPFSSAEIQMLWDNVGRMDYIDTVLIMIYSGIRPGELVTILTENINLDERYMRGGIKTQAGKNRIIPLNKKILPFIKSRLESGHEYMLTDEDGLPMTYERYYIGRFKKLMEQLGMKHKPHDCRHTFATLMDNAGANKLSIKRIMGHASKDITDKVYTHKDIDELLKAIDLI